MDDRHEPIQICSHKQEARILWHCTLTSRHLLTVDYIKILSRIGGKYVSQFEVKSFVCKSSVSEHKITYRFNGRLLRHALQRHNTENSKQIFPGKELRGYSTVPIPTFMFLWAIYIFLWSVCLFCCRKIGAGRTWEYIDRSQTHKCGNWD